MYHWATSRCEINQTCNNIFTHETHLCEHELTLTDTLTAGQLSITHGYRELQYYKQS